MAGMRSGNHESAKKRPDGTWTCSACGAESLDFELFEEVGVMESCLPDPTGAEKTAAIMAAAQAKQWIEDAEAAHHAAVCGTAVSEAAEILRDLTSKGLLSTPRRSAIWEPETVDVKNGDGTTIRRYTYDPEELVGRKFKIHTEKYEKKEFKSWEELRSAGTGTATQGGLSPSSKSWLDEMSKWFTTSGTLGSGPEPAEPTTSTESSLPVKNWASGYGSHKAVGRNPFSRRTKRK